MCNFNCKLLSKLVMISNLKITIAWVTHLEIPQSLIILGTNAKGEIIYAYWKTRGSKRNWNEWLFLKLLQKAEDSKLRFVGPAVTSF